jgi:SAM-dependent methyltransferase
VKWNNRYAAPSSVPFPDTPAEWLVEHRSLLVPKAAGGRALDVACGDGRNARYLAELGFAVDAVDISDLVIDRLKAVAMTLDLSVSPRIADLENGAGLPAGEYDVVVNFNYLHRPLFDGLARALRPGGLLLFETFARPHVDDLGRRFRPEFVLGANELLLAFAGLHVRHYFEGVVSRSGEPRGVASLVAERR